MTDDVPAGRPPEAESAGAGPGPAAGESPAAGPGPVDERKRPGFIRTIVEIVVIVAAAFALALLVQAFLVKPFTIHQVSMRPTLEEGDRVLLSRITYHFREPARGDVVVFHSPINAGEDLVKRVVGTPGDRISVGDGRLYVNGVAQSEPYLLEPDFAGEFPETVIPDGEVFVMGDNRNNSGDSRLFGPIAQSSIIGTAFCVYWPFGHWKGL